MPNELSEPVSLAIRLLGETDAIHAGLRSKMYGTSAPANRYFALQAFANGGVPARTPGATNRATAAARQAFADTLKAAEADGLITTTRTRGRHPLARLTPVGDERMRALCGLPGAAIAHMLLADVKKKTRRGGRWVAEVALAAKPIDWPGLMVVANEAAAALWRGWLDVGSDLENMVYFALTPKGDAALKKPRPSLPFDRDKDDPFSQEARTLYRETHTATLAGLVNDTPPDISELGEIPLPCGAE